MSSSTGRLTCSRCKSDLSTPKSPMLTCSSCKKGWHTYCHNPVVTLAKFKAMYEAERDKKAHPGEDRFSNWRCSMCPTPSWDRSTVVISSDDEDPPQPKPGATTRSKSASVAAATQAEVIIDLTEEFAEFPPRKDKSRARDTSPPRSRLQTPDQLGWEEYRSPIASLRLESRNQPSVTPPPPSATPSESMMIIDEEDVDLVETSGVSVTRGSGELQLPVQTQLPSEGQPRQTETRLLPQIIKEEMQELVVPPPVEPGRPRRSRKPEETKRFISTSRKGKTRMRSLVDFHLPFGPEMTPKADLGSLEEALRKLGLEPGS